MHVLMECDCHMGIPYPITWLSYPYNFIIMNIVNDYCRTLTWPPLDYHVTITWPPPDYHVTITRPPLDYHDYHTTTTGLSCDYHMTTTGLSCWLSHDHHWTIMWLSHDHHWTIMWLSHNHHWTIIWLIYDNHTYPSLQISSEVGECVMPAESTVTSMTQSQHKDMLLPGPPPSKQC